MFILYYFFKKTSNITLKNKIQLITLIFKLICLFLENTIYYKIIHNITIKRN